jgi:tryptophan synthase alpha chain
MNLLKQAFEKKSAFIGFVIGGDGGIEYCINCCLQLIEGGVNILEIGLPFSDPVADGPIIQRGSLRSLEQGTTPSTILEIARGIRKKAATPLILFSYYNVLLKKGQIYLKELKSAGFNAVIVVDLPPPTEGKTHPYFHALKSAGLHPVFLVTPSTNEKRLSHIAKISEEFIYYACQKGTTGIRAKLPEDIAFHSARIETVKK